MRKNLSITPLWNIILKSLLKKKKKEYSKLIIKDLKDYQWWCLKEILKKEQIDYAYDNTKNQPNLIIYLDENKKERLLADLDYYKIRYHAVF